MSLFTSSPADEEVGDKDGDDDGGEGQEDLGTASMQIKILDICLET